MQKLSRAQEEVLSLKQKLVSTEQALEKETKSLAAAREGLETLEKALEDEGSKAEDLFKEISSLKV
jgi:chromosome segregation ATPase